MILYIAFFKFYWCTFKASNICCFFPLFAETIISQCFNDLCQVIMILLLFICINNRCFSVLSDLFPFVLLGTIMTIVFHCYLFFFKTSSTLRKSTLVWVYRKVMWPLFCYTYLLRNLSHSKVSDLMYNVYKGEGFLIQWCLDLPWTFMV